MWHRQAKGVRRAIPGLCSQEGRVELPDDLGSQRVGRRDSDLDPQGMATEVLSPSSEVGTGR